MRRTVAAVAALVAVISLALVPGRAGSGDVRAEPFRMTETILPRSGDFAEPSIALSAKDHVFFCGPIGIPGGRNGFIRSEDWTTFDRIDIFDRGGGGDCDVKVGPDGAVYTANLQAWASAIRKSVDDGKTFTYQSSEDPVEQDRQWLATDRVDPNIVYLAYHDWTIGAIVVAKSLDGAKTWLVHSLVSSDPVPLVRSGRATIPGPIRVDPTNNQRLFMVWSIGEVTDCAEPSRCPFPEHRTIMFGRSEDGGITWTNGVAMTAPPSSSLAELIPWLSLDAAGNPYVAAAGWIVDERGERTNGLFMAASSDRGATWTGPVKVNTGAGAAVFPTVAAGAPGIANFAWIESSKASGDDTSGVWTVRFAQSRDALSAAPSFVEVAGPVIHHGDVCTRGIFCLAGGDRRLLDFMDMAIDSFGYAHMAVSMTVPTQQVLYWRQDAGPSATSEACVPTCVPVRPGPSA